MPDVSRRAVLALGAGAFGTVALGSLAAPAAASALSGTPFASSPLRAAAGGLPLRSHFANHVGERFSARIDGERRAFVLQAVGDLEPVRAALDEHRFSLVFLPDGEAPEGIYELAHPAAPAATLFLSPIGASAAMQAIVNRT